MYIELYLKSKVDSEVLEVKVSLAFLGMGASRYVRRDVSLSKFPSCILLFSTSVSHSKQFISRGR